MNGYISGFRNIYFVECSKDGHRIKYIELLVSLTDARFILSSSVFDALPLAMRNHLHDNLRVDLLSTSPHKAFLDHLSVLFDSRDTKLCQVCFLMLDDYLSKCPLAIIEFARRQQQLYLSGLVIDSTFCYPVLFSFKSWLRLMWRVALFASLRSSNPSIRLFALDRKVATYLGRFGYGSGQVTPVPDPPLLESRGAMSKKPRSGCLLFFGRHTARKGTAWALSSLCNNNSIREIRLVGELIDRSAIEKALNCLPSGIKKTIRDKIVSDEEAAEEFNYATVVVTPYIRFASSSNVILNAWCFGKKVICPNYGMMARLTKQYDGGFLYRPGDSKSFNNAVTRALAEYSEEDSASLRQQVIECHSTKHFVEALRTGFQENLPP